MQNEARLTQEELEEWRSNPVTEWLLAVLRKGCASNKAGLQAQLWADGKCDPETLGRVKAQEELIEDLMETGCEDWNGWSDAFEHQRDQPPRV